MRQIAAEEAGAARGPSCLRQITRKGLYQVAASGGTPVPVLELDASKYSFYVADIPAGWKAFPLWGI